MIDLTDKVAVITGAGSGIGKATALTFARLGAKVVCADIKKADATAEEIKQQGGKALAVELDVSKWEQWVALREKTEGEFGTVDILCNIAGIVNDANIIHLTEEQLDSVMNVNVKGVFLGMKALLPGMVKKGAGKIVNIASVAAHIGIQDLPSYSASKGAVVAMSRQVAMDFAQHNIQVNVVSPGIIETPMVANNSPETTEALLAVTPAKRMGKPEEIASMIAFLSSDAANFITGQAIMVDGGWVQQ